MQGTVLKAIERTNFIVQEKGAHERELLMNLGRKPQLVCQKKYNPNDMWDRNPKTFQLYAIT